MSLIDCDIHNTMPSDETLAKYLPRRWARHLLDFGQRFYYQGAYYPRLHANAARSDAWPPGGGIPGSDLDFMREQLLDAWQIRYGILNPLYLAGEQANLDFGVALAAGLNEWLVREWLEPEVRLRASIVTPYEAGELAAKEIGRWTQDPRFCQVLLAARTKEPLGRRKYWPLYEAAAASDLPVAIHFGGAGGMPLTAAGFPSFYFEDHCGMPQAFQTQLISLVFEGVFERFPGLKVVLVEGGYAWLPSLMWRMDRAWEKLGAEVPHVKMAPSAYIRRHCWFTSQPMEEPPRRSDYRQLLEQLQMPDRLMFATDYPHWDFDSPNHAFPIRMSPATREAIMFKNAARLYQLEIV